MTQASRARVSVAYRRADGIEAQLELEGDLVAVQRQVMTGLGLKWEGPDPEFDRLMQERGAREANFAG